MNKNQQRMQKIVAAFVGKTVTKVEALSINVIHFYFSDGTSCTVDGEDQFRGIPIIQIGEGWDELRSNLLRDGAARPQTCPNCESALTGGKPDADLSKCVVCKGTGVV